MSDREVSRRFRVSPQPDRSRSRNVEACGMPEVCPACELQRCARLRVAMMIARVPSSALSHLYPGLRLAGPAGPVIRLQERRAAGVAARGRRSAPCHSAATAGLGRPRRPRRADPAPAGKAAIAPAGHARHHAQVAPPPGHPEVDLPRTGQDGRRSAPRSPRSSSGSPPRTPAGATSGSRASCSSSATGPARPRSAGSSRRCGSPGSQTTPPAPA